MSSLDLRKSQTRTEARPNLAMKSKLFSLLLLAALFAKSSLAIEFKLELDRRSVKDTLEEGTIRNAKNIGKYGVYDLFPVTNEAEAAFRTFKADSVICVTGVKLSWDQILVRSAKTCR